MDFDTIVAFPVGWGSLVALFIPLLTALVTRYRAGTSRIHAIIAHVLSGVVAVLQMLTDDIPNDTWQSILAAFFGVIIPAVVSYLAVWQPVVQVNQRVLPEKGI